MSRHAEPVTAALRIATAPAPPRITDSAEERAERRALERIADAFTDAVRQFRAASGDERNAAAERVRAERSRFNHAARRASVETCFGTHDDPFRRPCTAAVSAFGERCRACTEDAERVTAAVSRCARKPGR